ncbi:TPA: anthranilate phosphoribosyltransferase [Candidatus Woesearchaeota archaeon]|nr:anthranilate phosphoribosyltransferase [Candidatus Woesearchaeota archaeon]HII68814.1 anthranilate phosphoribosyltransferase [Candidatus Woesearchaeota archaeon]
MIQEAIAKLLTRSDLTSPEAEAVMDEVMSGAATQAQIGGLLVALRMKGESIDEIASFARVMRKKAITIHPNGELLDVVGTGGDGLHTFNISTASAIVAAGAGVKVAKHGNRSVSSTSGAADVLTKLGVNIALEPAQVEACINEMGIGFMFAPAFHKAMKYAIAPRRELGVRTVFNVLGPLTNPAGAQRLLVGVYDHAMTEPIATVLGKLGQKAAMVVHGQGMDEITITGTTQISEYRDGHVRTYELDPQEIGIAYADRSVLTCKSPEESAALITAILEGKEKGPRRDIILLNAAAALMVAGKAQSFREGVAIAAETIDSGKAKRKLQELVDWTTTN